MWDLRPSKLSSGRKDLVLTVNLRPSSIPYFMPIPAGYVGLGIVRRGMAFGILALSADSHYVRVNGSYIEPLDTEPVEKAMRRALRYAPGFFKSVRLPAPIVDSLRAPRKSKKPSPVNTPYQTTPSQTPVLVRKRRQIDLSLRTPAPAPQYAGMHLPQLRFD